MQNEKYKMHLHFVFQESVHFDILTTSVYSWI
jgi:hypothetical protein